MYEYLDGTVSYRREDYFVLDVQGIGYKVYCFQPMLSQIPGNGQRVKIFTFVVVREDLLAIYGFISPERLSMFELLLTVSGIGPKVAGLISAAIEPSSFAVAVMTSNVDLISSVKGIGKKGAERIILELKDKLRKTHKDSPVIASASEMTEEDNVDNKFTESCHALAVLGYSPKDAAEAVKKVYSTEKTIEEIIKHALKEFI